MLYIFDNTETLIDKLPEGSFFDAIHYEVLNGENTFEFTLPTGSEYVVEGNLVAFRDLDSYWQVFEIKRLVDSHGDGLTRTAYCEHIFYELLDDIVIDKRPSAGATAALAGMLGGTRWQVGIVDEAALGASSTSAYYISALEAVQNVANAWKGELNWRCVISGGVITRYVDLKAMRGTDTGKQFAYSKDVLNIEREVDSSGVVTALYGRGKGIELDSGSYGRRLTFADVVAADKPADQEWVGDSGALAQWGRPGNRHRFDVFVDEEETDAATLLQKTRDELDRRKVPRATYRLDVVSLEELTGYEHEKVRLGDMVRVIDREFNPDLVVSARVVELERDILDPANTKVVLGSFAPTIVEATINTARRVNDMANRPFNTKWLDGKISVLQNEIENVQSYVFQTADDGILILDAADYATATKAMKLGGGIFAIANQKDGQGGWNWRTFGDGSGFSADLITAGMIDAGLVQIGSATTFEEGYDPSQISSVGMGVDDNCTGLWHFDGSLNSHKGLAAIFDGEFANSKWGQGLNIVSGKTLKIPTEDILDPGESSINFRVYNLADSLNGAVIFDLGDSAGDQAIKVGIANDGKLFIEDKKAEFSALEDSAVDYSTGVLTDVVSTESGIVLAPSGSDFAVVEDTAAEFAAGTLTNVEAVDNKLQLKYTPGSVIYSSDVTGGKTYTGSSSSGTGQPANAFDNDIGTRWGSAAGVEFPHWLAVDLDSGTTRKVRKLRIYITYGLLKNFIFQGSNGSGFTDIYTGLLNNANGWQEFEFANDTSYRYYRIYCIDNYTGEAFGAIYEVELMEVTSTNPGTYTLTGYREQVYNPSVVGIASGSVLDWNTTTPAGTSIAFQVAISLDGGSSYGSYQNCTKGGAIPGITAGMDVSNAKIKVKTTLTTTDNSVTPAVSEINIAVNSSYKTSGSWQKVYDISRVSKADVSSITWSWLRPTNTTQIVKAAVSTDGGITYGAFQNCTSGQAIPVLTEGMDISNARLKVQVDLSTTSGAVTPTVKDININISEQPNVAYGLSKSELVDWDNIAIQWKTDRLSLIINGAESAYIENPGQVTTLDTYAFIGSDKAGANQIGTVIDELRIDKVYQEIAKVNAWHIVDAPFYTSEEFKQWPGYVKVETDGLKVYDSLSSLRLLVGSWMRGLVRKYGIKVVEGEIYSSIVSTGDEDAKTFIRLISPNLLQMYSDVGGVAKKQLEIAASIGGGGGGVDFYVDDNWVGTINGQDSDLYISAPYGDVIMSSLDVLGTKNCIEETSIGRVAISARESPEVRYIDEGMGTLVDGVCQIDIDPIFMECIEPHAPDSRWYVQLTPYADVDLYIAETGADYFIVKERNSGTTTGAEFTWSLSATRKNYAHIRFREVV